MFSWLREHLMNVWRNTNISTKTVKLTPLVEAIDSKIFYTMSKRGFTLIKIISPEGKVINLNVKPDMTVTKVKSSIIKQFYGDDALKNASKFRLIQSFKFKWLPDNCCIKDVGLNENDELLLIHIRSTSIEENLSEEALKAPTMEAILQATSNIPVHNPPKNISSLHCPAECQNEIRKIFITLAKASARIIMYSPEAPKFYDILKDKWEARCKPYINPNAVKTLTEIGYSHKKVMKALRLRKSNMMDALEWLTEHQSDPEDEEDLDFVEIEKECQSLKKEDNIISIVDLILQSLHRYKRMDFKPDTKALRSLLEMGFEEKSIIDALKVTGNNQSSACEWLLGERRHSLQDLNEELDVDNPIYKAIMSEPRIQLSLTNPNMLLVYLSMLEVPVSSYERIRDPEVGSILDHIIATYHAEKHAVHLNQCQF